MKKILVTGASGFIGRHCLPLLIEKGYEVHALSSKPFQAFEKDVVWHSQNLLDNKKIQRLVESIRPSHCLHLAWYTEPGKYWSSSENLRWAASSISLLYLFQKNGGQRFVGAGTCAEYSWKYGHCSETTTPLEPSTLYGTCKDGLQKILASFSENTCLSSAWGRIFFLYGPHEHPARLVPTVVNSLLHNKAALCSHGNQLRDWMHVSDVASAFVDVLESGVKGPVNIASGNPVLIKNVIYIIAEHLNGFDKLRLGALPARNEPSFLTADVSRLQNEVGFVPKFELESGLKQTIDWWKQSLLEQNK
jgi:nucleoside-diphosphate-sugar epimerase